MTSGFGFPFLGGELEEGGEGKCHIRLELTYSMLAGAWNSDLMTMPPPIETTPTSLLLPFLLLLLSEPSANFLQLRGRRRQGRRRTFPGFGFQCGARAFASQGGVGGTPDALLGPWEPGAGRRLAGRAGVGTVGRRGGGALTSVLEQDVRQPMLDPLVRRGGGRRNLRVHTLDASCRRQGGTRMASIIQSASLCHWLLRLSISC